MADFDPDAFLKETAGSGGFDPDAFLAATGGPSTAEAAWRGALQGASLGFGDEAVGAHAASPETVLQGGFGLPNAIAGLVVGKLLGDTGKSEAYRKGRDSDRAANKASEEAHPLAYGGGQLAGGLVTVPAGGLGSAVASGAALGLGNSEADLTKGEYGKAALDTALGAGVGGAAHGVGVGLGKLATKASDKVEALTAGLRQTAADKAAAVTATARSEAGAAAQDLYRTVEHIRELRVTQPEAYAALVADGTINEAAVAAAEKELLGKSASKLPASLAKKAEKAKAFAEASGSEADRAEAQAAHDLSGKRAAEIVTNPGARYLKRALIGSATGAAGGYVLGGEGNRGVGAALGLGTGISLGPLIPTMQKALLRPEVRRQGYRLLEKALSALGSPSLERGALSLGVPNLTYDPDAERSRAIAAALRGSAP